MFEDVVGESLEDRGGHVPDDDLDGVLERLLAGADADLDAVPDCAPEQWSDASAGGPVLAYGKCAPSGWLALDLDSATADPARLSDDTLIEAMIGFDRIASWAAARQARLLAELARRRPTDTAPYSARSAGVGSEYAPDEAGVALHLSRGSACARIGLARRLLATPDTHALWESGRIDTAKARAVDDATVVLPDELARAVEARVLPRAPEQTLAQLKAALARAVIAADPDGAEQRHRQARRDRRVVVTAEPDGMGTLWAMLTATDAAGAFAWLTRLARGLGSDDPRSMDARRADILAALLNGRLLRADDADTDTDTDAAPGESEADGDEASDDQGTGGSPDRTDGITGSGESARRTKLRKLLGDPTVATIVVEHRDRLARFGVEYLQAALAAHGRTVVVLDDAELPEDLARDLTEVLTCMCARLYGRGSAARRAAAAVHAAANLPDDEEPS